MASGHFLDNRSQEIIERGGIDMIDEPKQNQSAPEKYASASVYGLRTKSHLPRRVGRHNQ
jgi:hypothetical protein